MDLTKQSLFSLIHPWVQAWSEEGFFNKNSVHYTTLILRCAGLSALSAQVFGLMHLVLVGNQIKQDRWIKINKDDTNAVGEQWIAYYHKPLIDQQQMQAWLSQTTNPYGVSYYFQDLLLLDGFDLIENNDVQCQYKDHIVNLCNEFNGHQLMSALLLNKKIGHVDVSCKQLLSLRQLGFDFTSLNKQSLRGQLSGLHQVLDYLRVHWDKVNQMDLGSPELMSNCQLIEKKELQAWITEDDWGQWIDFLKQESADWASSQKKVYGVKKCTEALNAAYKRRIKLKEQSPDKKQSDLWIEKDYQRGFGLLFELKNWIKKVNNKTLNAPRIEWIKTYIQMFEKLGQLNFLVQRYERHESYQAMRQEQDVLCVNQLSTASNNLSGGQLSKHLLGVEPIPVELSVKYEPKRVKLFEHVRKQLKTYDWFIDVNQSYRVKGAGSPINFEDEYGWMFWYGLLVLNEGYKQKSGGQLVPEWVLKDSITKGLSEASQWYFNVIAATENPLISKIQASHAGRWYKESANNHEPLWLNKVGAMRYYSWLYCLYKALSQENKKAPRIDFGAQQQQWLYKGKLIYEQMQKAWLVHHLIDNQTSTNDWMSVLVRFNQACALWGYQDIERLEQLTQAVQIMRIDKKNQIPEALMQTSIGYEHDKNLLGLVWLIVEKSADILGIVVRDQINEQGMQGDLLKSFQKNSFESYWGHLGAFEQIKAGWIIKEHSKLIKEQNLGNQSKWLQAL